MGRSTVYRCLIGALSVILFSTVGIIASHFVEWWRQHQETLSVSGSQPIIDLGSGFEGEILSASISISNMTRKARNVAVKTSCGCIDVSPRSFVVNPSDAQDVHFRTRLSRAGVVRTSDVSFERSGDGMVFGFKQLIYECLEPAAEYHKSARVCRGVGSTARSILFTGDPRWQHVFRAIYRCVHSYVFGNGASYFAGAR